MKRFHYFSISETHERFGKREISASELLEAHLARADELEPKLNAFVHRDLAGARAAAKRADERMQRGETVGPLQGIPVTVKSCIDVAGWRCPAGSLLRKEYVPEADAPIVARLRKAGAVLLGNTNTPEFLMAYETNNRVTGKTSNPWNVEYSAGGSSGGEAAAIAAGYSMAGIGSDGGGSIRTPAHFCGICGLKPTPGRIPATGHFPPGEGALSWLGVVGPMARSVADLQILFEVLAGPDAGDANSAPVPIRKIEAKALEGLRIGVLESPALGKPSPETLLTMRKACQLLAMDGFALKPMDLQGLEQALELWWYFFGPVIGDLLRKSTAGFEELLSPMLRKYLEVTAESGAVNLEGVLGACAKRDLVRGQILRQMEETPVLISPVSTQPAFRHGEGSYTAGDPHSYLDTMRYSQWLNLAGFPGLSVPMGLSPEGLPINAQLIGRPFEEELLLAVGARLEAARGAWEAPLQF